MMYISLPVMFLLVGAALCAPEHAHEQEHSPRDIDHEHDMQHAAALAKRSPQIFDFGLGKRSPQYDFGLGKRAYSYVSEYKRLPVYNFGLGKRSRPYSFGLGKRSVDDEMQSEEDISNEIDPEALEEFLEQYDDANYDVKRARPYSFGLGKRFADEETNDEKRARMYNFGLGKRVPLYNFGLGKRARNYNFGLGKRLSSKFNFGLGKRERDLHRFSFGLGKRSADDASTDDNDDMDA